jgi:hypothetical protein
MVLVSGVAGAVPGVKATNNKGPGETGAFDISDHAGADQRE